MKQMKNDSWQIEYFIEAWIFQKRKPIINYLLLMREYLSEKHQILITLLGTWDQFELIESHPASSGSLHHLDICHIQRESEIKTRPNNTTWQNILFKWRELFRWDQESELFFPLTRTTLACRLTILRCPSEKCIFARVVCSIMIPQVEEYFFAEWMIDEPSSPECRCRNWMHGQDYMRTLAKASKILYE